MYELAADAAFAYDTAHRLFHAKSNENKTTNQGTSLAFKIEQTKFLFDWFDLSDEECTRESIGERINFSCPSDFRAARIKELELRLTTKVDVATVIGDTGVAVTEPDLMKKVRKEVLTMAKSVAAITPDVSLGGKRAGEIQFDPRSEVKKRKKSRKSLEAPDAQRKKTTHFPRPQEALSREPLVVNGNNTSLLPNHAQSTLGSNYLSSADVLTLARSNFNGLPRHHLGSARTQDVYDLIARSVEQLPLEESRALISRLEIDQRLRDLMLLRGVTQNGGVSMSDPRLLLSKILQNNAVPSQMFAMPNLSSFANSIAHHSSARLGQSSLPSSNLSDMSQHNTTTKTKQNEY